MKRMSKREMKFRLGPAGKVRVRIERIERGHAVAVLEGVECRLELGRSERRDMANPGAIRARLVSFPKASGEGSQARGTRPVKDLWEQFTGRPKEKRATLYSEGAALETAIEPWEAFARRHPAGSLVEAEVLAVSRNKIRLRFEGGLQTRMSIGDYWDRWPPCGRDDRMKLHVPNRIEVIVRRLDPGRRILSVSMHGYPRDPGYCNNAAGYRAAYDAAKGMFRRLPWDRNEPR